MQEQAAATVEVRDIHKYYGAVRALDGAEFSARSAEIHGLVGENGAGKSTLIKCLCGVTHPDSGEIRIFGNEAHLRTALDAEQLGIQTVFQELTLIPDLTVADNLLHVRQATKAWRRQPLRKAVLEAEKILTDFDITDIDPAAVVRHLPLPQRQIIEIVKALSMDPEILILDEATSALLEPQVEWLFGKVRQAKANGKTIVVTTHRWGEVKELSDQVTIFRDGKYVGTYDTGAISEAEATTLMTGRKLDVLYPVLKPYRDEVELEVTNVNSDVLRDISFKLRQGEILGVGGLQGQGQRELFLSLFGALPFTGEVKVRGKVKPLGSPHEAIHSGIGFGMVPEDRKTEGLLLEMSIAENASLPTLTRFTSGGWLSTRSESTAVLEAVQRLRLRFSSLSQRVGSLSGGNQQKVVLARWLMAASPVLLLYDVTRGVDVGTKHDIYELMAGLAQQGVAILFYSSDTNEIANMSSRVAVMFEGRIRVFLTGEDLTLENIVASSVGTGGQSEMENNG